MKQLVISFIACIFSISVFAQTQSTGEWWIEGSAVPHKKAKLVKAPVEGLYCYTGKLLSGEFKIVNTPAGSKQSVYYIPQEEDANALGKNIKYQQVTDARAAGFKITYADTGDCYKIKIDTHKQSLSGELFLPPQCIYIVGGATAAGWDHKKAIPLIRDENKPYLFTFNGWLKVNATGNERDSFKFLPYISGGGPPSYHPLSAGEPIGKAHYLILNDGSWPDYKWTITPDTEGWYRIKLNLLDETIDAKKIEW